MRTARRVLVRTQDGLQEKRCVFCLRWLRVDGPNRGFDKDARRVCGVRNECRQCRSDRRMPRDRNYRLEYQRRKERLDEWRIRALRAEAKLSATRGAGGG